VCCCGRGFEPGVNRFRTEVKGHQKRHPLGTKVPSILQLLPPNRGISDQLSVNTSVTTNPSESTSAMATTTSPVMVFQTLTPAEQPAATVLDEIKRREGFQRALFGVKMEDAETGVLCTGEIDLTPLHLPTIPSFLSPVARCPKERKNYHIMSINHDLPRRE